MPVGHDDTTSDASPHPSLTYSSCMGEIRPGLWIGNIYAVTQLDHIYDDPTRWTVVTILNDPKLLQLVRALLSRYESSPVCDVSSHIEWKLPDTPHADFLSPMLLTVIDAIHKGCRPASHREQLANDTTKGTTRRACLVHCAQGISRSAAVLAAWLLSTAEVKALPDAMASIRSVRPNVRLTNLALLASLRAIEQCQGNIPAAILRMTPTCNDDAK
jgi:predicted protein tyrosine phosphatase